MADKVEYSRLLIKRSDNFGTIPTIPTGSTLSTFTDTDIFVGEFFLNTADDKLWVRTDSGIAELPLSGATSFSGTLAQTLANGNTTDGFGVYISQDDRIYSYSGNSYIEFNKIADERIGLVSSDGVGTGNVGVTPIDVIISYDDGIDNTGLLSIESTYLSLNKTSLTGNTSAIQMFNDNIVLNNTDVVSSITDTISIDPLVLGNGTGIKSENASTLEVSELLLTPSDITISSTDTTNYSNQLIMNNTNVDLSYSDILNSSFTSLSMSGNTFVLNNNDGVGVRNNSLSSGSDSLMLENRKWLITNHSTNGDIGSSERAATITTTGATTSNIAIGGGIPTGATSYLETRVTGSNADGTKGYFARIIGAYRKTSAGLYNQIGTNDTLVKTDFTGATATITYTTAAPPKVFITGEAAQTINWKVINKWGNYISEYYA